MAEAVVFNIAEEIIKKLGSRGLEEIGLWWGVKDEIEKLKKTVSMIKAVLLHAEEQSSVSNEVQEWLGMLKEAFYDADDLLDDFSTEKLRRQVMSGNRIMKEVRLFFSHSNKLVYGFKMGHKIKEIRDRLAEIALDRKFHLEERQKETSETEMIRERDQTHSSLPEVVVGREEDKKKIVELLFCSNFEENVPVISVVGIGGLGKTTLAQLVYNNQKVKTHFELKLWICVSDNFDVKLIVEKLVESVTGDRRSNLEMDTLKNILHENIIGKNYLIVLDDVWNEDPAKWFRLKDLLGLSEIESWSLFKQMAFKRGQVPSPSHEAIGKEIVAKCAGVPLAIRAIGALLYYRNTESECSSSSFHPSSPLSYAGSQLKSLTVWEIEDLEFLPEELLPCFTSLQEVSIFDCSRLTTAALKVRMMTMSNGKALKASILFDWLAFRIGGYPKGASTCNCAAMSHN
ncbi:hypothetical protein GH714_043076 [Hevea brasiliensis]|uniref:Uncharacterized protein n=1 Tax=Hevea brasiliensis TaxID=3981 RepID=A0A6A6K334_HEVBR|nr:hypothetical protein GH714_043076 [Hevea brasiliensis]